MANVRLLKPELEQLLNLTLGLDGSIQDATFFTGLYSEDGELYVRFSCFGNLFTVWEDSPKWPLSPIVLRQAIELIQTHGFTHIGYDDLGELYSGQNPYFHRHGAHWACLKDGVLCDESASWWHRFFDYI